MRLWRRDARMVAEHRARDCRVALKDSDGRYDVQLALVTNDIGEAVRGAELILCPTPAFAQHEIANLLAPHLGEGQVVFLRPGTFGSIIFAKAAHDARNRAAVAFAETGTLPWLTRMHGPFEVAITIRAKRLPVGVFPEDAANHALDVIGRAFPGVIEPCGDALSGALFSFSKLASVGFDGRSECRNTFSSRCLVGSHRRNASICWAGEPGAT